MNCATCPLRDTLRRCWAILMSCYTSIASWIWSTVKIKPIPKARFEALCFLRRPNAKLFAEEREWYADQDENILGIVLLDKIDHDWSYVVLGRDELASFAAIDQNVSLPTVDAAREELHNKMLQYSAAGEKVFPQGRDRKGQKIFQLFHPVLQAEKRNPDFGLLSAASAYSPAKEIIAEIAYTFEDPDGNYIEQFQGNGFDARLWELYLYAALHENDFDINRDFHAPDYLCSKYGVPLVIEATTVNPTQDGESIESIKEDPDGIEMANYMAIKFANALYSKLQKRYWDLEHVKGMPLVLAVADFRKPEGVFFSAKFLEEYLYGQRQSREGNAYVYTPIREHVYRDRKKPSGYFSLPDSENISAVLFSDGGTLSKFNRMGKLAGFGKQDVNMLRIGQRYETSKSPEATVFEVMVNPPSYVETWSEGIYIFHNPRAKYPLVPQLFPDACHTFLINGKYAISVPDRFPTWSKTIIFSRREA